MTNENRTSNLARRLERLEQEIGRLANLLAEQASEKKRRRRSFTIRVLLVSVLGFALLFAWFGSVYRQSLLQASAVDRLIDEGAFVLYSPRGSALVSLLPGDAQQPSTQLVNLLGDDFFRSVMNVSTGRNSTLPRNKREILKALSNLPQLERLRLTNLQLRTDDLAALSAMHNLQSLDLNHTKLDSGSMPWLRQTQMRWFDASHTCFSDRALYDLAHCRDLQELRLERTCVTDVGLKHLYSMPNLRHVNLRRSPISQSAVKKLSDALPGCVIDWEPLRFQPNGMVDTVAARRGRIQYGRKLPKDPRLSRRAAAPLDAAPVTNSAWTLQPYQGKSYNGFMLDVF